MCRPVRWCLIASILNCGGVQSPQKANRRRSNQSAWLSCYPLIVNGLSHPLIIKGEKKSGSTCKSRSGAAPVYMIPSPPFLTAYLRCKSRYLVGKDSSDIEKSSSRYSFPCTGYRHASATRETGEPEALCKSVLTMPSFEEEMQFAPPLPEVCC